ncbi:MAG: hypothetical protein ACE5HY_03155 [Candidatus Hydrothermarchaeales archaeon]
MEDWSWKPTRRPRRMVYKKSRPGEEELIWKPMRIRGGKLLAGVRKEKTVEEVVGKVFRARDYKCGFCKAAGERPLGTKCPVCKSKGRISIMADRPAVRCAFCKGRGEDKPRSNVTCLACKGKGVVPIVEPIEVCAHCRGLGHEPGNRTILCGECRGAGVMTIKQARRFVSRPSGSEGEAIRAVYELGEVSHVDIGARLKVTSAYADYICNSLVKRGYLEKVSRNLYVLTPDGEAAMAKQAEKARA